MSDQYDSGSSDRSGASPWNSPDPTGDSRQSYGSDANSTPAYGSSSSAGQYDQTPQHGTPSYSQASYPESAYAQQPGHAQQGQTQQYGTYGRTDQYGYGAGPKPQGMAIAALVIGVIALLTSWFPILGLVGVLLAVVAVIVGIVALNKVKKGTGGGKGLAIGGIVTGLIALVLGLIVNAMVFAGLGMLSESGGLEAITECSQLPQEQQQACIEQKIDQIEQQQGGNRT